MPKPAVANTCRFAADHVRLHGKGPPVQHSLIVHPCLLPLTLQHTHGLCSYDATAAGPAAPRLPPTTLACASASFPALPTTS